MIIYKPDENGTVSEVIFNPPFGLPAGIREKHRSIVAFLARSFDEEAEPPRPRPCRRSPGHQGGDLRRRFNIGSDSGERFV
jgi:hypothetical protein